jgi:hypothetical protein
MWNVHCNAWLHTTFSKELIDKFGFLYIPYSHFCKYPGPPTWKHITFPNQGRDIYKSVNKGYFFKKIRLIFRKKFICLKISDDLIKDHSSKLTPWNRVTQFACFWFDFSFYVIKIIFCFKFFSQITKLDHFFKPVKKFISNIFQQWWMSESLGPRIGLRVHKLSVDVRTSYTFNRGRTSIFSQTRQINPN